MGLVDIPEGKKTHNGNSEIHNIRILYSIFPVLQKAQSEQEKFVTEFKPSWWAHITKKKSFCLLGDLGFSQWWAPVKFNFLLGPLALSLVGLTRCDRSDSGHVSGGFGGKTSVLPQRGQPTRTQSHPIPFDGPLPHAAQLIRQSSLNFSSQLSWNWVSIEERLSLLSPKYWAFWDFNVHMASKHKEKIQHYEAIFVFQMKACMYERSLLRIKKTDLLSTVLCDLNSVYCTSADVVAVLKAITHEYSFFWSYSCLILKIIVVRNAVWV